MPTPGNTAEDNRSGWSILVAVAIPLAILSVDFAGVSVALPSIAKDFGVPESQLGAVVNAFALGAAAPVLLVGRKVDQLGRRRILISGMYLFLGATVLCAFAPTLGWLILGRFFQGIGTALFMPASLSVLTAAFNGSKRDSAVGIWGAVAGVAGAAAPLIGGVVLAVASWRWFFGINVPLLIAGIALASNRIPETTGVSAPVERKSAILGVLAPTAAVIGLQLGGAQGWTQPQTILAIAVALFVTAVFVRAERGATSPLVERIVSQSRSFRSAALVANLSNWGFGALTFLLTFWLQNMLDLSAFQTGLMFLIYSVPFALFGVINSTVVGVLGTRNAMGIGCLFIASSFAILAFLAHGEGLAVIAAALALSGIGQGLTYNVSTTAAMSAVSSKYAGSASGVLTTLRNIGVAAGISVALTATQASESSITQAIEGAALAIVIVSLLAAGAAWFLPKESAHSSVA